MIFFCNTPRIKKYFQQFLLEKSVAVLAPPQQLAPGAHAPPSEASTKPCKDGTGGIARQLQPFPSPSPTTVIYHVCYIMADWL
ncbi:hypothetical protein J6590_032392 [Homalodisca vitripennis]|nr:hypothetical protein J6590_032392 [Homalodisca vitripennis]